MELDDNTRCIASWVDGLWIKKRGHMESHNIWKVRIIYPKERDVVGILHIADGTALLLEENGRTIAELFDVKIHEASADGMSLTGNEFVRIKKNDGPLYRQQEWFLFYRKK